MYVVLLYESMTLMTNTIIFLKKFNVSYAKFTRTYNHAIIVVSVNNNYIPWHTMCISCDLDSIMIMLGLQGSLSCSFNMLGCWSIYMYIYTLLLKCTSFVTSSLLHFIVCIIYFVLFIMVLLNCYFVYVDFYVYLSLFRILSVL